MLKSICVSLLLAAAAAAPGTMVHAQNIQLPAPHPFSSDGDFPAPWAAQQSAGTTLTLSNGQILSVAEKEGEFAYVQRPFGTDNATLSARIYQCGFIYFIWDENNWVGVGKISPTPFGRFASIVADNGKITETDHRGIHAHGPHNLRMQLGEEGIRLFYGMSDREGWDMLRVIGRKPGMAGPPRVLALGKNYQIGREGISVYHNYNATNGPRAVIDTITMEPTPHDQLKLTAVEKQWLDKQRPDPIADLLKIDRDPNFDAVASFYPEMRYVREITGVPGQLNDIGVNWLGRLDNTPWADQIARFTFDGQDFAASETSVTRSLENEYLPIINLESDNGHLQYGMKVFGWSQGFDKTAPLYGYVKLSAWNKHDIGSVPTKLVMRTKDKDIDVPLKTEDNGTAWAVLRYQHPDPTTAEFISAEDYDKALDETVTYWSQLLATAAPFDIPESRVNNAYKAWIAYALLNTDYVKDHYEVHDGSGFYDSVFGYSASLHGMALDLFGMHDYVKELIAGQLHFQQKDGLYLQDCGLPDHGSLTLAIALHYQKTHDAEWLKSVAPQLTKLCEWIITKRAENPGDELTRGLIKFRPYNDHPQPVYNYLGNTYCVRGLEEAAKAFAAIGDTEKAKRYGDEAAQYRKDVLASMDKAKLVHHGVEMLPIEPDTQRLLKLSKYRGGEYYGLVASNLFEHEFFADNDPRGALYINMLENHGGLSGGSCEFQEGIDHAYTYGYWMDRMNAGEVRKTILGLYSSLAYGMSHTTYSPVEVTMYKTAQNHLTLPHTYSVTQQLRLLRNMMLREKNGDMLIGEAIPTQWLTAGNKVAATDAPTEFGPASFTYQPQPDGSIKFELTLSDRNAPNNVKVRVRHPSGKAITGVTTPDGKPAFKHEGQVVDLGKATGTVTFTARF